MLLAGRTDSGKHTLCVGATCLKGHRLVCRIVGVDIKQAIEVGGRGGTVFGGYCPRIECGARALLDLPG